MDKRYFFGPNTLEFFLTDWILYGAGTALVILAIISYIVSWRAAKGSPFQHLVSRFWHLFLTIGLLMLLWVGFRYENIPWLSARIVAFALALIGLIWLGYILKYWLRIYPGEKRVWGDKLLKQKYLTKMR